MWLSRQTLCTSLIAFFFRLLSVLILPHITQKHIKKNIKPLKKEKRAFEWSALFCPAVSGFQALINQNQYIEKSQQCYLCTMHDADSISRLCSHTPCHVWSDCLHAPDLPDLSHIVSFCIFWFSPSRIFLHNATVSFCLSTWSNKNATVRKWQLQKIKTVRKLHFRTYIKKNEEKPLIMLIQWIVMYAVLYPTAYNSKSGILNNA